MRRLAQLAATFAVVAVFGFTSASAAQSPTLFGGIGGSGASSPLLVLDPATGATVESRGTNAFGLTGLAISPVDDVLYGVTTPGPAGGPRFLVRVDRATGIATIVGPLGVTVADITFTADGTMYGWSESSDDLVTINLTTGVATVVGNSGLDTFGSGIAFDAANNRLLYAGDSADGELRVVDRTTGLTTIISTMNGPGGFTGVAALAFSCDGILYAALNNRQGPTQLATIDPASGNVTVLGPSQDGLDAIVFDCPSSSDDDDDDDDKDPAQQPAAAPVVVQPAFTG